jgi:acetyl esterase/lipase
MLRLPIACAFVLGASTCLALAGSPADEPKKQEEKAAPKARVIATLGKKLKPTALVTYKTVDDGKRPLSLHVFRPAGWKATDKRPVLVTFHGGGWTGGDPTTQYYMADRFAKRGWVGISVQYRLANPKSEITPFDSVKDARSAVRYVRAHAAEIGVDPDKLVANGGSAGGHLAAATAMFGDVNDAADDLKVSPVPQLMILFYPVIDTGPKGYGNMKVGADWKKLSPVDRVVPKLPPTLVLHGDKDTVTPYAGAKLFHERMKDARNDCELVTGTGGGHGYFTYEQAPLDEAMAQVDKWLKARGDPTDLAP